MIEWVKVGFEGLKLLKNRAPIVCALASSVLLFSPDAFLRTMHLLDFKTRHSETLGLVFIVGTVIAILQVFSLAKNAVWDRHFALRQMRKQLHVLSPQEKQLLCGYMLNDTKTKYYNAEDGVVQGLVHSKVLYRSSSVGSILHGFAYNIQPWAYEYLRQNLHLITEGVPLAAPNVIQAYESEADPHRRLFGRPF